MNRLLLAKMLRSELTGETSSLRTECTVREWMDLQEAAMEPSTLEAQQIWKDVLARLSALDE